MVKHKVKHNKTSAYHYKIPVKYIVSCRDNKKAAWDIFVLGLAIYSGFIIPMDFAFSPYFT